MIVLVTLAVFLGGIVAVCLINAAVLAAKSPGPHSFLARIHREYSPFGWHVLAFAVLCVFACIAAAAKGGAM